MSEVIAFHPRVSTLVNLYEVVDEKGEAIWGGNDTHEAIRYLRNSPVNCRILVSGWESDEEDAHLVGFVRHGKFWSGQLCSYEINKSVFA